MPYNPNLLPTHSRVDTGIYYNETQRTGIKKRHPLWYVFSYIGALIFLLMGVSLLKHFVQGVFFLALGLILIPQVHESLEKLLRFKFTWLIKTATFSILFFSAMFAGAPYDMPSKKTAKIDENETNEQPDENKKKRDEENAKKQARIASFNSHWHKADSLAEKNKYAQSVTHLTEALKYADGNDVNKVRYRRATYYSKLKKYADAVTDYTELISDNYKTATTYYERAQCYQKQNKKREAVADLRLSMQQGNAEAEKLYEKINPERRRVSYYETLCCDGTTSNSTGRGTCSHHGGVCNWNSPVYETYRQY